MNTQQIIEKANEQIKKTGYFKISSCDHYNWDITEHISLVQLYHKQPKGMKITLSINFRGK